MQLFRKKLKRDKIAKELYECRKIEDNQEYKEKFINIVNKYFSKSYFENDETFIMGGRKKILFDEFNNILDGNKDIKGIDNPIRFAIGDLEEFICNNNHLSAEDVDKSKWKDEKVIDGKYFIELRNKNDKYSKEGYICLQEKQYIEKMISRLKEENGSIKGLDEIITNLINKLHNLPNGTETSIIKLLGYDSLSKYNNDELTKICYAVFKKCEQDNIILDFSEHADEKTGQIYNIEFIKKKH